MRDEQNNMRASRDKVMLELKAEAEAQLDMLRAECGSWLEASVQLLSDTAEVGGAAPGWKLPSNSTEVDGAARRHGGGEVGWGLSLIHISEPTRRS
eukprot:364081-Chlamydomonas_euryale.AAC.13